MEDLLLTLMLTLTLDLLLNLLNVINHIKLHLNESHGTVLTIAVKSAESCNVNQLKKLILLS